MWRRLFFNMQSIFQEALYIYEKSSSLTILFWGALYIYEQSSMLTISFCGALNISEKSSMLTILFWGALYKKFSMLVILFREALYILRSRQCLPFYFGEHCIFMRSCLHLPFYHVWLRWRKSYNSFYNPNSPWIKSPPLSEILVYFQIPFPRTAPNNNDQCSWLT